MWGGKAKHGPLPDWAYVTFTVIFRGFEPKFSNQQIPSETRSICQSEDEGEEISEIVSLTYPEILPIPFPNCLRMTLDVQKFSLIFLGKYYNLLSTLIFNYALVFKNLHFSKRRFIQRRSLVQIWWRPRILENRMQKAE